MTFILIEDCKLPEMEEFWLSFTSVLNIWDVFSLTGVIGHNYHIFCYIKNTNGLSQKSLKFSKNSKD